MVPRRSGFTLVELLVVIAIIGVLVALLLPAVQAARESANRAQCSNNLKQMGLALHNYHDTFKTLPPGAFWRQVANGDDLKGSGLLHLLPFMELSSLYDKVNFVTWYGNGNGPSHVELTTINGKTLLSTKVAGYICPSDMRDRDATRACSNYSLTAGSCQVNNNNGSCPEYTTWNAYSTVPHDAAQGKMFNRVSLSHNFAECTDGLSNTVFVGEVRRGCSAHMEAGWLMSNNGNGLTSTVIPINYDTCELTLGADGCKWYANWATEFGYKSRHPGGAQFGLGDGSVRFFPETIDHVNYQNLGNPMDGKMATVP